jgi:hypothetical protein
MAPDRNTDETGRAAKKLEVIRIAASCNYPTADIDEMLAQIESGYESVPPPRD